MQFHLGQTRLLQSKARFTIGCAGVRGGKSTVGPVWLAQRILENPGKIYLITSPTYDILDAGAMTTLQDWWRGTDFDGTWNRFTHRWTFRNRKLGVILARSCDNYEQIQAFDAACAWADEAGQYSWLAWRAVVGRTDRVNGPVLITTTPYIEKGQWLKDLVARARAADANYCLSEWPSWWNPSFSREAWNEAKETSPRSWFEAMYCGKFGKPENATYPDFGPENVRSCTYDPSLPILVGSDFNNSPLCWVMGQARSVGDREEFWIFDELVIKHAGKTIDALDELWARYGHHKAGWQFYGDATSQNKHPSAVVSDYIQIESDMRFRAAGATMHYPRANPSVIDRINSVNVMILNAAGVRRFFVDPSCRTTIQHFESAANKEGTRIPDKSHFDPHCCFPASCMVATPGGSVPITSLRPGDAVLTHRGVGYVEQKFSTGIRELWRISAEGSATLCTREHPFKLAGGWGPAEQGATLWRLESSCTTAGGSLGTNTGTTARRPITRAKTDGSFIRSFGMSIMAPVRRGWPYITGTAIATTTTSTTWNSSRDLSIHAYTRLVGEPYASLPFGMVRKRLRRCIIGSAACRTKIALGFKRNARSAEHPSQRAIPRRPCFALTLAPQRDGDDQVQTTLNGGAFAVASPSSSTNTPRLLPVLSSVRPVTVSAIEAMGEFQQVYNLKTTHGSFFADGFLVSNCDAAGYVIFRRWPISLVRPPTVAAAYWNTAPDGHQRPIDRIRTAGRIA